MDRPVSKLRETKLEFYRKQGKIHAKSVDGRHNRLRWAMVWLTQIVFYGACWLTWDTQGVVRQAVLFDIAHEKFYLFGLVLWPQDALLLAIALIVAATALFLVTALGGRLFCGFACPQTIYTMIFTWIEARIEGDHLARLRLDQRRPDADKIRRKLLKHGLWLVVAGWTSITFVGYFTPIRELLPTLPRWQVGHWEGFWLIFYAAFTYVQAGLAREAVCQHMCPYARFQSVMFDPATKSVSYDRARGEPRSNRQAPGQSGDCIDCGICVEVCPTGIDIRDGLQYACINCGLCIDGCDDVMRKLSLPTGLIRFAPAEPSVTATPRPRLAIYLGILATCMTLGGWTLAQRPLVMADILRDRGALSRETPDGRIENSYTLKLMNLAETPREFTLEVSGAEDFSIVGRQVFRVEGGSILALPLTIAAPAESLRRGVLPISLDVVDTENPENRTQEQTRFIRP